MPGGEVSLAGHAAARDAARTMKSLLLAAALSAPALLASTAQAAVTPPKPTGSAPVGFTRTTLTDHFRTEPLAGETGPRRLPLRIWYPAAHRGAHPARTLTQAEQRGWEQQAQAPPGTLDGLGAAATHDARPAPGRHPVLLMSPGLGETTALLSAHAADLASHGYVVVGIDVPGDTTVLEVDGELRRAGDRARVAGDRSRCARATCASCSRA